VDFDDANDANALNYKNGLLQAVPSSLKIWHIGALL
jgi:hypothetical protein